ncbi:MAG: DNA polymerase III subunit gamma/tau [Kofleriaceae bacterium]
MSYLVLARKYRPSKFSEVVGQEHVTRTLGNAFGSGRVHHAFLFCGPRGCGKTTLARIVGKALNCENLAGSISGSAAAEACGTCSACVTISNGSAVDYIEMDGASNRGIDAIRELTEAVRYQPAALRKKVYVIDEVHMLTAEAFNALLKTLEEPPPHVTFVLATTEPHKLPNTILSRCQRFDFKLVPAARLSQHLAAIFAQEHLAIEPAAISLLVRESGGSVRDALSLCDQLISYVGDTAITEAHVAEVLGVADRTLTRTLVRALAQGDGGTALGAVESAIERGVDEVQLARAIVRYLRDLAVLQVAPDRAELVDASDEERAELTSEARGLDRSRVTQMFDRMLRCCDELGKTLQPRLVLDCALIDVATIEPLVPLGDLIARLGELEARLGGKPSSAGMTGGRGGGEASRSSARGAPAPADRPADRSKPVAAPVPAATSEAVSTSVTPNITPPAVAPVVSAAAPPVAPPPGVAAPGVSAKPSVGPGPGSGPGATPSTGTTVPIQPSGPVPAPTASDLASGSGPTKLAVPSSPDEALRAWGQVLSELEARRKFSLLGPFQHARVLMWTTEQIDLGFPVDVHSMGEMAGDKQNLDDLRAVIRDLAPDLKSVKLSVKLLDEAESNSASARSVIETTRDRSTAERTKREAEAREHPITKHVLHTFGAQIKEIKTDVGS